MDKQKGIIMNRQRRRDLRNTIFAHIARTINTDYKAMLNSKWEHTKGWLKFKLESTEEEHAAEQIMSAEIKRLEDRVI